MRLLIVEDEHLASTRLSNMIKMLYPQSTICAICDSIEQTLEWLNGNPVPDLAFFDIQLGDGISFDLFEQHNINFPVIFTTAYDQYAIKAFKVNGLDYLLKPLNNDELKKAFEKFENTKAIDVSALNNAIVQANKVIQQQNYKTRFLVKVGEHLRMLNTESISFFYSEAKASYVRNHQGASYAIDQSVEQIELQLNPTEFYRISRKYLININSIEDIISYGTSRLKLKMRGANKDEEVIVSRERVKDFKLWLEGEPNKF